MKLPFKNSGGILEPLQYWLTMVGLAFSAVFVQVTETELEAGAPALMVLGEVLRRRYAGSWEMTLYPGAAVSVPAVDVRGSRLFPLMKVYRRLTTGEEEDLRAFYAMVTERLGAPAQVN